MALFCQRNMKIIQSMIVYCIKIWLWPLFFPFWVVYAVTFPSPEEYNKEGYENISKNRLLANPNSEMCWLKVDTKSSQNDYYKIPAFYLTKRSKNPRFVLLFSHGNGMDIFKSVSEFEQMFRFTLYKDLDIFFYEYPGYSQSKFTADNVFETIKTTEANVNRAIEVAWTYLVMDLKINPKRIILCGQSIGSGPTIHLASRDSLPQVPQELSPKNAAALILISTPLSIVRTRVGKHPCLVSLFKCFDKFQNHEKIFDINPNMPVCTLHAQNDWLVPFYHMIQIQNSLPGGIEQLVYSQHPQRGGHNFNEDLSWEEKDIMPQKVFSDYIQAYLAAAVTKLKVRIDAGVEDYPEESELFENYETYQIPEPVLKDYGSLKCYRCFLPMSIFIVILSFFLVVSNDTDNLPFNTTNSPTFDMINETTQAPTIRFTTNSPTKEDSVETFNPTSSPTSSPTSLPTSFPTTSEPTQFPTTSEPTLFPTTSTPTQFPTTNEPTQFLTTSEPIQFPTINGPTNLPTMISTAEVEDIESKQKLRIT